MSASYFVLEMVLFTTPLLPGTFQMEPLRCLPISSCSTIRNRDPLLAVEEPENQLYPILLHELAEEFREYAQRGGQVFVSTHSPDFLNAVKFEEIYWLEKQNGFSTARRVSDSELLRHLVAEGDRPGILWRQGLFTEVERV